MLAAILLVSSHHANLHAQLQRAGPKVDTVLIAAPDLLPAMRPWIAYRSRQGHQIAIVPASDSAREIQQSIQALARRTQLKFVVLVGDTAADATSGSASVATEHVDATIIQKWGADPKFASDSLYGDLDDDGIPELAVGRITADSASQVTEITSKIINYERNPDVGIWRRRVNLIAGVGGFGMIADKVLESAAKKFITDGIPASFQTSMTQASWRSPYSPDPRLFQAHAIERMNEGCLAWVYLGHGRVHELDYYRIPNGGLPIFSVDEVRHIRSRAGSPIAVFLSCYAGNFAADPDCLAEQLLAHREGPAAVIAGSSVTMPYAMTVMGNAMLKELFETRCETLGEVLLKAKQELAKEPVTSAQGELVDQLAAVLSPNADQLGEERREHVRLFHLFGDPLMRIRHPNIVALKAPEYGVAGESIEVHGESDIPGPCIIELVCRRDRLTFKPPRRPKFEANDPWLSAFEPVYAKANNPVWQVVSHEIAADGTFDVRLDIPKDAVGAAHVRVFVRGDDKFATGSTDVYLRPELAADEQPLQRSGDTAIKVRVAR